MKEAFRVSKSRIIQASWALSRRRNASGGRCQDRHHALCRCRAADERLCRSEGRIQGNPRPYLRACHRRERRRQAGRYRHLGTDWCADGCVEALSQRIAQETGIAIECQLIAAVHDHSAPAPFGMYGNNSPKSAAYTKQVEDASVEAVRRAKDNLQPAKIGIGTGKAYVNINRREYSSEGGWWLGYNPEGPSDKTMTVIRFDTPSGKPIALLINYSVHAVVMGGENYQISGDLAGTTSRYVENYYRGEPEDAPRSDAGAAIQLRPQETSDKVVALWTSGAAGDQNPISLARGSDFTMVDALGKILGEETVRVATAIHTTDQARVWGKQLVFTCPGRKLEAGPVPRKKYG